MKISTVIIILFAGLVNNTLQNEVTAKAVYDGYFEGVYSFIIEGGDDFVEETIEFSEISSSILKEYDLQSEKFVGQHFSITYSSEVEIMEDENGTEEEWISYSLKSLKKF